MRIIDTSTIDPLRTEFDPATREWIYNGLDCTVTFDVLEALLPQLDDDTAHTYRQALAMQAPIFEITLRGVRVDTMQWNTTRKETERKIKKVAHNLHRILVEGVGINVPAPGTRKTEFYRSTKTLLHLFYTVLQLKEVKKRNAKGGLSPTVNEDALLRLKTNFYAEPIINHILKLRGLEKAAQFLATKLDSDGRMRARWNIAGTVTGRLSSESTDFGTGTNNQNIARPLRRPFIPDPGFKFCNVDLEQADARNVGAICWELFLDSHGQDFAGAYLDACESGDLHTKTCMLGWPDLPWTGDLAHDKKHVAEVPAHRGMTYRDLAKRLGHGTNYDGLMSVGQATHLPMKQIKEFQARYFAGFPCIKAWHEWVQEQLDTTRQITTLYHRRRTFFGRPNDKKVFREALAFAPQSMTGDEMNAGWLRLWRSDPYREGRIQVLNQVHDSLLIQYREEDEDWIVPFIIDTLTERLELKGGREFVMPVEAAIGWNWAYASKANPNGLLGWKGPRKDTRETPSLDNTTIATFFEG